MKKSTCTSKTNQPQLDEKSIRAVGSTTRIVKLLDWLSRCVSCLAVTMLCSWMAWSVLQDRSPQRVSVQINSKLTLASSREGVDEALDGHWQFADVPWSIKIDRLPEEQARHELNRLPPNLTELSQSGSSDLTDVFDILDSLNATVSEQQGIVRYRVEKPDFCLVGFAPQANRNAVGSVRLAQSTADGTWNYLEFSSRPATISTEADKHLLPLLGGGTALACKRDASRKVLAELVTTEVSLTEMQSNWEKDGWAIEKADASTLGIQGLAEMQQELSTKSQPKSVLICTKDSSAVAVVTQNAVENESLSLLLIGLAQK